MSQARYPVDLGRVVEPFGNPDLADRPPASGQQLQYGLPSLYLLSPELSAVRYSAIGYSAA